MIKNYLLIAIRNIRRNAVYSFINIAGLSVGLACSILILLWVADEVSFDRFHTNYTNIHQVHINQEVSGRIVTSPNAPYPAMDVLRSTAGVSRVALINHGEGYLLAAGDKKLSKMGTVATGEFLSMFDYKIVRGDATPDLSDPKSIVLSRSTAKDLFGTDDVVSKVITLENNYEFTVVAVIEDIPLQSTLQFDFLLPVGFYQATQSWMREATTEWDNYSFRVFVELAEDVDAAQVNATVEDMIRKNNPEAPTAKAFLYPMSQWHLYSNFENGKPSGGMIGYVVMFGSIGVLILIIACINFMNLSTARSESRSREVGIRKAMGSRRKELIRQFLGESILVTAIAFLFALVIVETVLPLYNIMVSKQLSIEYGNPVLWGSAAAIVLITGCIAGSYPAFYLSGFQPVTVLKGKLVAARSSVTLRQVLVVLQFSFSIFLIISTIVIAQQIEHVKSRDVGYDRERLLLIWTNTEREQNFQSLREDLKNSGVVKSVCKSSAPITRIFSSTDGVSWPGKASDDKVGFITIATEYGFTETMGIRMVEGRDFDREHGTDTSAVIVNKAALATMGMTDPIGKTLHIWGDDRTIIGVMEDVVMGSPYHEVDPLAMVFIPDWSSTISVRLEKTDDLPAAVSRVENIFKKYDPAHPLWHRFADDEFETKFSSINLVSRLASTFTGLAVFISCLGLFGLAAFTAEQRTKEVCIRKILGASVSSLVVMMSKDFSRLTLVAFALAAPVAWLMLDRFLQEYPYRIQLQWWVLPLAGCAVLLLTLAIVSTQALRAAASNPAESLRNE